MGRRRLITAFCIFAYTIVFAHSVIPHSHHCLGHEGHNKQESHIHDFGHCEELNTYVISDFDFQPQLYIIDIISNTYNSSSNLVLKDKGHKIYFDLSSTFKDRSGGFYRDNYTRAP